MKGKIILTAAVLAAIVITLGLFWLILSDRMNSTRIITSSQLEKAVNISQLSTAEFVYNGIAEHYNGNNREKAACYICYDANVKVGIQMEDVGFIIDEEAKTVTPVLPPITIQAAVLDEQSLSYIPRNPDIALKEIIAICKEDVMQEADHSDSLYQIAEENLKAVIEALLSPVLDSAGYSLVWETEK